MILHFLSTLTYLIIVQDVINVQAGKFPGINKRAGCNKAVQVGIFQESIVKKTCRLEKFQKLINVQDVIRLCRLDFFKKIIKRAACLHLVCFISNAYKQRPVEKSDNLSNSTR